jgi:hypothetical protein
MAEIYKQQIEHKAEDARMLKAAPFKDYISQGLGNVAEGFQQLDKYYQDRGDKELAAKMDYVVQEANAMVEHWEDFNTDGRNELMSRVMDLYDQALADSTYDAQGRLNVANPEAKNIFGLKLKEKILKQANEHVYNEKQRDFNAFADIVANVKDPKKNETALRDMIERVSYDPDHLLTVDQIGVLSDAAARKAVVQTIGLALLDERYGDAAKYITNPFYTKFLTPEDDISFRQQLKSALKTKKELERAAGASSQSIEDDANLWIATRDALYDRFRDVPGAPAFIDEDMNTMLNALYSGKSLKDITVLQWVDGLGVSADAVMKSGTGKAVEYWDSLKQTRRQQIINKYRNIVKDVLPDEYKQQQYDVARAFRSHLYDKQYIRTDEDDNAFVDLTNTSNDDLRTLKREADELKMAELGLDEDTQKLLRGFYSMYNAKFASAAKAASYEYNPVEQRMSGETSKSFMGGGNLTEAMIRSAQKGEERPSIIKGMLANMTRLTKFGDLTRQQLGKITSEGGHPEVMGRYDEEGLKQVAGVLGSNYLSPTMSDLMYFNDGGKENANALAVSVGNLMKEMGEVDSDGDLVVPKANTYRFMTYAIPVTLAYISVWGNDEDLKNTGIKRNVINSDTVVDMVLTLQNIYADKLDKPVEAFRAEGTFYPQKPEMGISVAALPGIQKSDPYNMLATAMAMAQYKGLTVYGSQPDQDSMISLGVVLNGLADDSKAKARVYASDSDAKARIDYRTKALQQHKKMTKKD